MGKVELEGGTVLSDSVIKACNKLLIRMEEVDYSQIWKIGNKLGLLNVEDKEGDVRKFQDWDSRDARNGGGVEYGVVEESQKVFDADN